MQLCAGWVSNCDDQGDELLLTFDQSDFRALVFPLGFFLLQVKL